MKDIQIGSKVRCKAGPTKVVAGLCILTSEKGEQQCMAWLGDSPYPPPGKSLGLPVPFDDLEVVCEEDE